MNEWEGREDVVMEGAPEEETEQLEDAEEGENEQEEAEEEDV